MEDGVLADRGQRVPVPPAAWERCIGVLAYCGASEITNFCPQLFTCRTLAVTGHDSFWPGWTQISAGDWEAQARAGGAERPQSPFTLTTASCQLSFTEPCPLLPKCDVRKCKTLIGTVKTVQNAPLLRTT